MATLTYRGQLVVESCWCGVRHAVPQELADRQDREFRDGRKQTVIHCPLGHSWIRAGEGEAVRLRRQLRTERDIAAAARAQRDQAEASARAYKGAATKARRRSAAGVCPVPGCGRSFKQLRRHMASQHPDFDPAA